MMLKTVHESLDEIPENYQELYSEQNGKYILTGIMGVKTDEDVSRLQTSLQKERDAHKDTKSKLSVWGSMDHSEVVSKLDRFNELELAAGNKIDDVKLEEMAEARAKTRLAPVERENKKLSEQISELTEQVNIFKTRETQRTINDAVREALTKSKASPNAYDDALLNAERHFTISEDGKVMTRDGVGVTPGVDVEVWLTEMQERQKPWWPSSVGGGAKGSSNLSPMSKNPWSKEHWNITEQGQIIKNQGIDKAKMYADAAGSFVGATAPKR